MSRNDFKKKFITKGSDRTQLVTKKHLTLNVKVEQTSLPSILFGCFTLRLQPIRWLPDLGVWRPNHDGHRLFSLCTCGAVGPFYEPLTRPK